MDVEKLLLKLEREDQERTAAVRQMLIDEGRQDLADDLDRRLRDVRLGLDFARNCWHSISPAQRRVLELMETGRRLIRDPARPVYHAIGAPHRFSDCCRLPTARALCAHELIVCDGTATDPEARFVLSERGRFVLQHGRPTAKP